MQNTWWNDEQFSLIWTVNADFRFTAFKYHLPINASITKSITFVRINRPTSFSFTGNAFLLSAFRCRTGIFLVSLCGFFYLNIWLQPQLLDVFHFCVRTCNLLIAFRVWREFQQIQQRMLLKLIACLGFKLKVQEPRLCFTSLSSNSSSAWLFL